MLESLEAYSLALLARVLGWSSEKVHVFLSGVQAELMNRKLHLYSKLYFVFGRKQEAQKEESQKEESQKSESQKEEA